MGNIMGMTVGRVGMDGEIEREETEGTKCFWEKIREYQNGFRTQKERIESQFSAVREDVGMRHVIRVTYRVGVRGTD